MTAAQIGVTAIAPKSGDDPLKGIPSHRRASVKARALVNLKRLLH